MIWTPGVASTVSKSVAFILTGVVVPATAAGSALAADTGESVEQLDRPPVRITAAAIAITPLDEFRIPARVYDRLLRIQFARDVGQRLPVAETELLTQFRGPHRVGDQM